MANQKLTNTFHFMQDNKYYYLHENGMYKVHDKCLKNIGSFHMFKGYDANEQGLRQFKKDFTQWRKELLNVNDGSPKILYTKYKTNRAATLMTFHRFAKECINHHTTITRKEYDYHEQCNNGGLQSCIKGIHQSYGYDFTAFYPSLLVEDELLIPTCEGEEVVLNKLPISKNLKVGIYHVRIISENENFLKLFNFSKANMYTNYSLAYALKNKKKFNITVELIQDGKPNAYIYEKVESVKNIFNEWYTELMKVKQQYPKNKLIKHLLSSLWGQLIAGNVEYMTEEEINKNKYSVSIGKDTDYHILNYSINETSAYYKLLNVKQPYKYNIRLKPFLTSYGRTKVAEVAMKNVDSIIRIHTDGIVYNKPIEHNLINLIPEEKTTGLIEWKNQNNYLFFNKHILNTLKQ